MIQIPVSSVLSILLFYSFGSSITADLTDVVQTAKGPIRGEILQTVVNSVKYSSFRAIPYGKPPIGRLRFRAPKEADAWTETLNATSEANVCPQAVDNTYVIGDEDCLYLNVYTPKTQFNATDNDLLPVMVWIFGGSFRSGVIYSTYFGPDFLIEEGVILVVVNYRLGALGFLSLDHPDATGNAGLKDQVLALKWVQENIQNFGGDRTRVTIFGQSAGAVCVQLHTISDLSRGLYSNSIAMSGSPLNFWAFMSPSDAVSRAFYLGRNLGLDTDNKTALLETLYNATAADIVTATAAMVLVDTLPFEPTYENESIANDEVFLTECPVQRYRSGKSDGLPHILGFCSSETVYWITDVAEFKSLAIMELKNYLPILNSSSSIIPNLSQTAKITADTIADIDPEVVYTIVNITSDLRFIEGVDRTQRYLTSHSSAPVYYYRNSFDYPQSLHRESGINLSGTAHVDDIAQIFWIQGHNQPLDPNSDIGVQRTKMVRLFTNFAKYGDPTPNGTDDTLLNVVWTPSGREGNCLEITDVLTMGVRPIDETVKTVQAAVQPVEESRNGCAGK